MTYNSSFGPIRSALSRSKQDLLDMDSIAPSPRDEVVFRRPRAPDFTNESVSSGMMCNILQLKPIAWNLIYKKRVSDALIWKALAQKCLF